MTALKRVAVLALLAFILIVFATFAYNFYRNHWGDDSGQPGIIFERSDRPARV